MGPNFCSHLLTGSCFSKLQSAGGPLAKRLRLLLGLEGSRDPRIVPAHPPPPRCAWRLNRTSTPLPTAALCKGSSFFNVFPFFLKRKTIYWSVRGFLPLKFFKAGRVLPDSVLCWPLSVGSLLDGSSLAKCSLRPHLWA